MAPISEANETGFAGRMRDLEARFAATAAADGDVYLPNFTPSAPVDAVFIGMEPSLGRWARTPDEAATRIAAGFRNFMWSPEDFILHYAARTSICASGGTYHITDVSKGAMTVEKANVDRRARYARWAALLDEELRLIEKPGTRIIAIGREVGLCLARHGFNREFTSIIHYSQLASAARTSAVLGREPEFRAFAETVSLNTLVEVATDIMREQSVPAAMAEETLTRIRRAKLSESHKKLAFAYVTSFTAPHMP